MEMGMGIADGERCLDSSDCEKRLSFSDDDWWNELPEDVQEEALAWLPADSLIAYRSVSMEWNALLSSTKFLGGLWVEAPVNRKPWLVVWEEHSRELCQVYCFYTKKWYSNLFLSFLRRDGLFYTEDDEEYCRGMILAGSAFGRLLVLMWDPASPDFSFYVCNPYTQKSIKLPASPYIEEIFSTAIVDGQVTNNNDKNRPDIYNVVQLQMGNTEDSRIVVLYDSSVKSWRLVGHLPQDLDSHSRITYLDGYFYCLVVQRRPVVTPMMLIFSIQDGDEMPMWVEPLPQFILDSGRNKFDLITCGPRLLVVTSQMESNGLVIVWEFHKHSSNPSWGWKEIARMPETLRDQLNFDSYNSCKGVENCVCFIYVRETAPVEVLVYNLSEKSWNWIPSCPLNVAPNKFIRCMALQARPDMNVG